MVRITFPAVLQRHVPCPPLEVDASSLRQAFDQAFEREPRLRSYLLDDAGGLRAHVTVFVDGVAVRDRVHLRQKLEPASQVDVLQALSGG
jgi:sulfur-carrier protein